MLQAIQADSVEAITQSTFSPEEYEAELARLEAQEAQQTARQQQAIVANCAIENLFEQWQQGRSIFEVAIGQREAAIKLLATAVGSAFLSAITASSLEERKFRAWLEDRKLQTISTVDYTALLLQVFQTWQAGAESSVEAVEQVSHYLSLAAGEGALLGLAESQDEQRQFRRWLKSQQQVHNQHEL